MKIYLGNLSRDMNDAQLGELMQPYGTPTSAEVVKDRGNGESKGFGFVEFSDAEHGKAAIAGLDGKEIGGRVIKVNEARPKKDA